jgi:hypothetical protein
MENLIEHPTFTTKLIVLMISNAVLQETLLQPAASHIGLFSSTANNQCSAYFQFILGTPKTQNSDVMNSK